MLILFIFECIYSLIRHLKESVWPSTVKMGELHYNPNK